MNAAAYLPALAALVGSAIGGLTPLALRYASRLATAASAPGFSSDAALNNLRADASIALGAVAGMLGFAAAIGIVVSILSGPRGKLAALMFRDPLSQGVRPTVVRG